MINTKFDVECRSSTAFEKKSFEPCDRNIGMSGSHCMKRLPVPSDLPSRCLYRKSPNVSESAPNMKNFNSQHVEIQHPTRWDVVGLLGPDALVEDSNKLGVG